MPSETAENESVAYCEHCKKEQPVRLVREDESVKIDGVAYTYLVWHGYCNVCSELTTPQELLEENQRSFSNAVRAHNGIVSQETVESLTESYNIRPRPLSSLLQWGEHTYARYMDGDIPSKAFSDVIATFAAHPLSYLLHLISHKESITPVAYRKSKAAAERVLSETGAKYERIAAYLLGKTESNSPLALQKELYYAQGLMLAFYDKPLINEECQAWRMGPVFPDVWENVKPRDVDEEALEDSGLADAVRDSFTADELSVLDAITTHVACYSPLVLKDITHKERPWLDARGDLPEDASSDAVITVDEIRDYFLDIVHDYGMESTADFGSYMAQRFIELL